MYVLSRYVQNMIGKKIGGQKFVTWKNMSNGIYNALVNVYISVILVIKIMMMMTLKTIRIGSKCILKCAAGSKVGDQNYYEDYV